MAETVISRNIELSRANGAATGEIGLRGVRPGLTKNWPEEA